MLEDEKLCTGCNACGDACPRQAIIFETDIEGFWYPEIDEARCNNCGLCKKTCPIVNIENLKKNDLEKPICYAAINKNLEIRFDSTSGGFFSALAEKMYRNGGYVGGAIYNEDFSATHFISNDKQDLIKLRSSKYLQSGAIGFYSKVKVLLENGQNVLVCGTPCQMAALRMFLDKNYENLLIVDFICAGVASPKAHRKYFDALEDKYNSKVIYFKAKNKEMGWRNLTKKSIFANGKSYYGIKGQDLYSRAYHSHKINRQSCYNCKFKGFPRIADISMGDYWGVEKAAPELDDNIGTSAVIINNQKGKMFFEAIQAKLKTKETSLESMLEGNQALLKSRELPIYDRKEFFEDMDNVNFFELAEKHFPLPKESKKTMLRRWLGYAKMFRDFTQLKMVPMWQFFKLNFFTKGIKSNWKKGYLIYPTPYSIFEIAKDSSITLNGNIRFGLKGRFKKSKLESRLAVDKGGRLIINGDMRFGYGCNIEVHENAELIFGGGGGNTALVLICGEKIHMGANTYYGRDVSIRDVNTHIIAQQGYKPTNPVFIGDNVWLCSNCAVMPGVKIGDGVIIGAHSVVMSPIPPRCLVSGHPAKVIDDNISWKH